MAILLKNVPSKIITLLLFSLFLSLALIVRAEMKTSNSKSVYGKTKPLSEQKSRGTVRRYVSVIELLPKKEEQYRKLHANVWPEVVTAIKKANIQNYSIHLVELGDKKFLFSYLEYSGSDPKKDFASIGDTPTTRDKWWPITEACQQTLPGTPKGEQWLPLEMLMHTK